jgi:hypothetical protein
LAASNYIKMGPWNVNDCVAIVLRNPDTTKTALTHISSGANVASLEVAVAKLLEEDSSKGLEARILGARFATESGDHKRVLRSKSNLLRIARFIDTHPIRLLSAQVGDRNQPTAFVVDPITGLQVRSALKHPEFTIQMRFLASFGRLWRKATGPYRSRSAWLCPLKEPRFRCLAMPCEILNASI